MNARRSLARIPALRTLATLLVALARAEGLAADEWYVDASASCAAGTGAPATPFCTIQEAIDAAAAGDTVHVARGIYAEALAIGKDLVLVGTEGRGVTIVDGGLGAQDVVAILEGAEVSITGLTLRNAGTGRSGIRVANATPPAVLSLMNSTVSGNRHGGIRSGNGTLSIVDSAIEDNQAYVSGGGIYSTEGDVTVIGSTISNNEAYAPSVPYGGGIFTGGRLTVVDSAIDDNAARTRTISGSLDQAYGGGLYLALGGVAVLENSSISGNAADVTIPYIGNNASGGAILNRGHLTVEGCVLADNFAYPGPAQYTNARVIDSTAGTLELMSSTLAGTYSQWEPRFAVRATPGSKVLGSIVWGNDAPLSPLPQVRGTTSGLPTVSHSDVQGGWEGPGGFNLAVDPRFVDPASGDYALQSTSGVIDRGNPDLELLALDLAGNPRLNDGDLDRGLVIDMGAFEFGHASLAVTGDPVPGGQLELSVEGTPGMSSLLAIGAPSSGLRLDPFGILFFALGPPTRVVSLGTIPAATTLTIPPTVVGPVSVVMQVLALEPAGGAGKRAGNVSNPVLVRVP